MGLLNTKNSNENELVSDFHYPTSKKAIIIFVRNPELGKCKTRLAKTIGDEAALEIYNDLLKHTADITCKINADKYVYYSENISKNDLWDNLLFRKKLQTGDTLGKKMTNAFTELFSLGYEKILIVGSDLPNINTAHINLAFESLNDHDYVIGPAKDGGYYLLGMLKFNSKLFIDKDWGNSTVLKDSLNDLKKEKVYLLETLNDIDIYDDLKHIDTFKRYLL